MGYTFGKSILDQAKAGSEKSLAIAVVVWGLLVLTGAQAVNAQLSSLGSFEQLPPPALTWGLSESNRGPRSYSMALDKDLAQLPPPAEPRKKDTQEGLKELPYDPGIAAADLGPQIELRRYPRARNFTVTSETEYGYTSNVLLADGNIIQRGKDAIFSQSLGFAFQPRLVEQLTSIAYARYDVVRYDEFRQFNFDGNSAGVSLSYPVANWFTLYGDWSANRSYYLRSGDEFYKTFDTRVGAWRQHTLGLRTALYYGYQFDWLAASPSELNRADNAFYVGVNVTLVDKLTTQCFFRFRVRDYLENDRTDLDHLLRLGINYAFSQYLSISGWATYGHNDSNVNLNDYNVFTGGGGLSLAFKF